MLLLLLDRSRGAHRLRAAAGAHAADRAGIEVIGAYGELDVLLARGPAVGDIEAAPAIDHPGLGPGVARHAGLRVRGRIDVAGHVARRHAEVAATGDEHVSVVLAHAGAKRERLRCAR